MQTGMYAISEMASLFNVSRQTLIYYDKIGLFKPAVVNERATVSIRPRRSRSCV